MLVAALGGDDPGAIHERRLMAHMLPMAACQLGHPITMFVEMVSDNGLIHATQRVEFTIVTEVYRFSNTSSGRCDAGKYVHRFSLSVSKLPRKTTCRSRWRNSESVARQSCGLITRASNCPTT